MQRSKLKAPIKVENYDYNESHPRYNDIFPNVIRAGIFGPSGCGKTNVLIQILMEVNTYSNIYLCTLRTSLKSGWYGRRQCIGSRRRVVMGGKIIDGEP